MAALVLCVGVLAACGVDDQAPGAPETEEVSTGVEERTSATDGTAVESADRADSAAVGAAHPRCAREISDSLTFGTETRTWWHGTCNQYACTGVIVADNGAVHETGSCTDTRTGATTTLDGIYEPM